MVVFNASCQFNAWQKKRIKMTKKSKEKRKMETHFEHFSRICTKLNGLKVRKQNEHTFSEEKKNTKICRQTGWREKAQGNNWGRTIDVQKVLRENARISFRIAYSSAPLPMRQRRLFSEECENWKTKHRTYICIELQKEPKNSEHSPNFIPINFRFLKRSLGHNLCYLCCFICGPCVQCDVQTLFTSRFNIAKEPIDFLQFLVWILKVK